VISYLFRLEISIFSWDLSVDPLLQPLMEGLVLLVAVSIGALRTMRVKNKLELFR
jgi:ribose transport system permease protein